MKTIFVNLSLVAALMSSHTVLAEQSDLVTEKSNNIEVIRVVSHADPARYEIFSLEHTKSAIEESVDMMIRTVAGESLDDGTAQFDEKLTAKNTI